MKFTPWNYQQYAINHIIEHNASGLFLDMGMG
ncbi:MULTISPECIES: helicase [Clostridium]